MTFWKRKQLRKERKMGRMSALGMKEALDDRLADLDSVLVWHLTSNHYPPLTTKLVPYAKEAIQLCNDSRWEEEIEFPNGSVVSAGKIVEDLHLESFLNEEED
jgi:hypothetical protein